MNFKQTKELYMSVYNRLRTEQVGLSENEVRELASGIVSDSVDEIENGLKISLEYFGRK